MKPMQFSQSRSGQTLPIHTAIFCEGSACSRWIPPPDGQKMALDSRNEKLCLTKEMWDSPACRAAVRVLIMGGILSVSSEEKFSEFVEMFLARRNKAVSSSGAQNSSSSNHEMQSKDKHSYIPISIPSTYDRAYCINFSVNLNESAAKKYSRARNERETEYLAQESFQQAYNVGKKARNRENSNRELQLLKIMLSPKTVSCSPFIPHQVS
jgi:hypothetical protein